MRGYPRGQNRNEIDRPPDEIDPNQSEPAMLSHVALAYPRASSRGAESGNPRYRISIGMRANVQATIAPTNPKATMMAATAIIVAIDMIEAPQVRAAEARKTAFSENRRSVRAIAGQEGGAPLFEFIPPPSVRLRPVPALAATRRG